MLYGMIGVPFVLNSALRKFDFIGQWSVSQKKKEAVKENSGADMQPEKRGR